MSLKKLGRYDLIRVLGKGAMGLVYEGRDPNLDRRVAIKTIKVENLSEEAAREYEIRFRTEARSAARLQHPNIVSVYDSDRDQDIAYLVMEFVQGQDLKHHLDTGRLYTLEQTLGIMADLLSALDYAHRQNIVHRDIKPANLLIEPGGRVKLTDFGVARIQDSGDATRTQGSIVGTLKYMAPEQVQGLPVDARADLFAAGIVLYQLLTGRRPFDGDSDFVIIQQIVGQTPQAPTSLNDQLPPAIDAVIGRALAKSRDLRFGSAQDFLSALQAVVRDASDKTVVPQRAAAGGGGSTWTSTMRASEPLTGLQSGAAGMSTSTGSATGTATMTQELELVYWKDIKESTDAEDLEVFIAKFPDGIYADLARRRLRKLASPAGESSGPGLRTGTGTVVMPPAEKTVVMDRGFAAGVDGDTAVQAKKEVSSPSDVPAAAMAFTEMPTLSRRQPAPFFSPVEADGAMAVTALTAATAATAAMPVPGTDKAEARRAAQAPESSPGVINNASPTKAPAAGSYASATPPASATPATPSRLPPSLTLSRKRLPLVLAAVAAFAVVVAAFVLLPGHEAATPANDVTALPASAAVVPASAPAAIDPTAPVAAASATVAKAPQAQSPASRASAALASKKPLTDKERLAKQAQAKTEVTATSATPEPASAQAARKPAEAAVASTSNPRQACESRMLIAFQMCMSEQCAKPAFAHHPVCVERQQMEQERREARAIR